MNKEREKIIDWLKKQIDSNIVFDCVPENEEGWHEVKRENVIKILDGLIPQLKTEVKKLKQSNVLGMLPPTEQQVSEFTKEIYDRLDYNANPQWADIWSTQSNKEYIMEFIKKLGGNFR